MPDYSSIGLHIRKQRKTKKMTQADLAEAVGISVNYVGAIERGEKLPSLETFLAVLNALDLSADAVLSDALHIVKKETTSALGDVFRGLDRPARDMIVCAAAAMADALRARSPSR